MKLVVCLLALLGCASDIRGMPGAQGPQGPSGGIAYAVTKSNGDVSKAMAITGSKVSTGVYVYRFDQEQKDVFYGVNCTTSAMLGEAYVNSTCVVSGKTLGGFIVSFIDPSGTLT